METRPETLLVRQHERLKCSLRVQVAAAPECGTQVRLARTLGDGSRVVNATVIDCSPGGLGINSSVFFPKTSVIHVRITATNGAHTTIAYEGPLRVQRVAMIGREPTYYLGTSFVERPAADTIELLMNEAKRNPAPEARPKGAAVA